MARVIVGGGVGRIGLLPVKDGASPSRPGADPVPGMPISASDPPGGCGAGSSAVMDMILGTRPGDTNIGLTKLFCTAGAPVRGMGASGSGARRPRLIGVDTVRADGSPTVFSTGSKSSRQIASICTPNEVNVVQLRRARCAHEDSSMLSAKIVSSNIVSCNMASLNMASSGVKFLLLLWTPRRRSLG
jgi:hypothetical protein